MPLARPLRLALALCLLPVSVPAARAAWLPQGNPVCTAPGTQQQVSGCPDGNGGVYLTWGDPRSAAAQVWAQHLFGDGSIAPGWPAGGLQLTTSLLAQFPTAVPDGTGGLLVISQVGSDLVALRVDAAGTPAPGFPVNGVVITSDLTNAKFAATPDGAGGAWLLRQGDAAANGVSRVRLTRVTRDGTIAAGWTAGGVTLLSGSMFVYSLHLEADPAGGAVATASYYSYSGTQDLGLFARVRANGVIAQTLNFPPGVHGPIAAPDGHAGVLATWVDSSTSPTLGIYAHWDSTGSTVGPVALTLGGPSYDPVPFRATTDGAGGAYVIECTPNPFVPFVSRVGADGSFAPGWNGAGVPLGGPVLPEIAMLTAAGGVLTFWSTAPNSAGDLGAMLVSANGAPASGWAAGGNAICTAPGRQSSPVLIPDGLGGVIGCWLDLRDEATTGQDVYATRLLASASPVATDAALVEARAEADRVLLRWWSADGPRFAATVERGSDGAGWSPLAEVRADAAGTIDYEDDDVEAGATYGYRLAITENGQRRIVGETTIHVPGATSFALEPVRPNPSRGDFAVAFTLSDAGPATIEVIDLAGRVVRSEAFAPGRAGRFVLRRAFASGPGVYLLRLTQGGLARTTRLVHVN